MRPASLSWGIVSFWGLGWACRVAYELEAGHPFIYGQFILAGKVVEMLDQARGELSNSGRSFGSGSIDDRLCEVRVELVRFVVRNGSVGGHLDLQSSARVAIRR